MATLLHAHCPITPTLPYVVHIHKASAGVQHFTEHFQASPAEFAGFNPAATDFSEPKIAGKVSKCVRLHAHRHTQTI